VINHTVTFADDSRKTIGLISPRIYRFVTAAPERMEVIAGACRVRVADCEDWIGFVTGTWFDVPGQSFFEFDAVD
jgi:uncharacterized protein YaiE (UPF0345 family)